MLWLRRWRRATGAGDEERRALEDWVRLRFQLPSSDPMIAIIGAFGRLVDAGMSVDDATETVLRIMRESEVPVGTPPDTMGTAASVTPYGAPGSPGARTTFRSSYARGKASVPPHGAC
jgi:hypothetical protein